MSIVFSDGIYLGSAAPASGSGGGDVTKDQIIVKSATIPTAGSDYVGAVYQYVGETNSTYTHGYIYECKAVVESDTTTYVWERIDVQPGATRGRFLALWNCATGLAESNPPSSPYPYGTGDYFIVGTVGTTNYKPSGSSYVIGTASTTVETGDVAVNDTYYYDGTNWNLQKNTETTVDQTYDPTSANAQSGVAVKEAVDGVLPSQAGNSGKFLTTDGTEASWETITIPSVDIDGVTVTKNASDELQASAVMNARTGTDVLPIWQGTQQQWTEGVGTDWYNWRTDITANVTNYGSSGFSDSGEYAYLNGVYVAEHNGTIYAYSSNGTTWESKFLPQYISTVTATDTFFIGSGYGGGSTYITSTDGINWTEKTASNVDFEGCLNVANNVVFNGVEAYTTDGDTWTTTGFYGDKGSVVYYNGTYFLFAYASRNYYYSTDLTNWTSGILTNENYTPQCAACNGNVFIVTTSTDQYFYSTDGINWTKKTQPFGSFVSAATRTLTAGDGVFIASLSDTTIVYSSDGLNWSHTTDTYSRPISFCNGYFYLGVKRIQFEQGSVYTLSTTPETTDTVYSAPNTASALTITSVGTGTITLSDNNTYTYTQSGDEVTYQSIGEAHPTWLCNINGVGVKVGTTMIADNTDTSTLQTKANLVTSVDSSSTDTQYPSAKLFYDTVGDIETALNTINSGS